MDASGSPKRAAGYQNAPGSAKRQKVDRPAGGGGGGGMSFAARMMAKMGYQQGSGLGKEGTGIVNPIQVQLRPHGAGVGAVKERPDALQRDEPRKKKKEPEAARRTQPRPARQKTSYEITPDWSDDSDVEPTTIIDRTGGYKPIQWAAASLSEADHAASYASREVDAFADAIEEVRNRWQSAGTQEKRLQSEIENQEAGLLHFEELGKALEELEQRKSFDSVVTTLEGLQAKYSDDIVTSGLGEIAVSALSPSFKWQMADWEPLEDAAGVSLHLRRIEKILDIHRRNQSDVDFEDDPAEYGGKQLATVYESLIFSSWLPRVRGTVLNEWQVSNPSPMLLLVTAWKAVLPQLAYDMVVNQLIAQKLIDAIKAWKPGQPAKHHLTAGEPHVWLFPWLEHLDEYHLDIKSSSGVLAEVKRKFRTTMSTWNPANGLIPGLDEWRGVKPLQREINYLLEVNLLPRLARHLHDSFEVDPSDQDIEPLEMVLRWVPYFSAEKFSRVLLDSFFPKWLNVLHMWLTSEPNYDEIGQWFSWWQSQFPEKINKVPDVASQWEKGLTMMNQALDLGPDRVKAELSKPSAGPNRPIVDSSFAGKKAAAEKKKVAVDYHDVASPSTFKDVVEDLCERESLVMLPLRKAHPATGLPLYRITASAAGTGGIIVYLKGDVVWAQTKDKSSWEPVDIFDEGLLSSMAEGK